MSSVKHQLKTKYEEQQVEWKIKNFYSRINALRHVQIEFKSAKFFVGKDTWAIYLCRDRFRDDWHISASCDEFPDEDVEVETLLALKRVDGKLDESLMVHDGEKYDGYYYIYNCTDSEFLEKKRELTTSNSLTIVCTIKSGTSYYPQPALPESPSMKLIGLDLLSDNFKNLLANRGSCDVTLQVKDKTFKAHKAVLMARSSIFSAMFEHETKENATGLVNIPDCDPETFHEFLEYVYCGKLENVSFPSVLHLYTVSDKYDFQELKSFCIQYLERCLTKENVCDILVLAENHDEAKLLSLARGLFFRNVAEIVNTIKWKKMLENKSDLVNKLIMEMGSKMYV